MNTEVAEAGRKFASIDDVLSAADRPVLVLNVPEWGGALRIKTLSQEEREGWEKNYSKDVEDQRLCVRYLIAVAVDENDRPLFRADLEDELSRKSGAVIKRIFDAALAHNGMGRNAVADAKKD